MFKLDDNLGLLDLLFITVLQRFSVRSDDKVYNLNLAFKMRLVSRDDITLVACSIINNELLMLECICFLQIG